MLHRVRPFLLFSAVVLLSFTMLGVSTAAYAKAPRNGHGVVLVAKRQLGIPYRWGGADRRGFDSSGLVRYVFGRLGVHLPHSADHQAARGRRVSLGHLRPGDAVFWGTAKYYYHVAIYVGHGRIIDAPHTGAVVSFKRLKGEVTARRYLPAT
jgi:peptidoglycan DL-endopeptidase CwlO